jgi:membrane protein
MREILGQHAIKRGGYTPIILDFLLSLLNILLLTIILVFELLIIPTVGLMDTLVSVIYLLVTIVLIGRFYFCKITKIEMVIERFILSLANVLNIVMLYIASSMIYTFFTDKNNIYQVNSDSVISNIVTGVVFLLLSFSILSLIPYLRNVSFELYCTVCLVLFVIIFIIQFVTTDNWQIITILYTLSILILSKDNINLFTKNKVDIEEKKEEIERMINTIKIIIGIVPLSLYAGISISQKFPIKFFSKKSILYSYNNIIYRSFVVFMMCLICFMFIYIILSGIRRKVR